MNICGIPIKQLNLVEDRADYYKHRHQAAHSALVQALQTLTMIGDNGAAVGAPPAAAAAAPATAPAVDFGSLAALLTMSRSSSQVRSLLPHRQHVCLLFWVRDPSVCSLSVCSQKPAFAECSSLCACRPCRPSRPLPLRQPPA
jgi:hypothetical protein